MYYGIARPSDGSTPEGTAALTVAVGPVDSKLRVPADLEDLCPCDSDTDFKESETETGTSVLRPDSAFHGGGSRAELCGCQPGKGLGARFAFQPPACLPIDPRRHLSGMTAAKPVAVSSAAVTSPCKSRARRCVTRRQSRRGCRLCQSRRPRDVPIPVRLW